MFEFLKRKRKKKQAPPMPPQVPVKLPVKTVTVKPEEDWWNREFPAGIPADQTEKAPKNMPPQKPMDVPPLAGVPARGSESAGKSWGVPKGFVRVDPYTEPPGGDVVNGDSNDMDETGVIDLGAPPVVESPPEWRITGYQVYVPPEEKEKKNFGRKKK